MVDALMPGIKINIIKIQTIKAMKKLLIILVMALICQFLYTGCLKTDHYFPDAKAAPLIRISNSNWPQKDAYASLPMDSAFGVKKLNLLAGIAFAKPLDQTVTVTFEKDDTASRAFLDSLTASAERNNTTAPVYALLPENCYALSSNAITIPAGTMNAALPIEIFPGNFSGSDHYIVSFSIKNVTGEYPVAQNFKSMVFTLRGY